MLKESKIWIKELSDVLSLCTDAVQEKSKEYEFYTIKGFNPDVIRLAVYKLNHCNCWDIAFQQRADVWHATGNFASNSFKDLLGDDADGGWRDDIEIFKNGYDSPVEWIRDLVDKVENI